MAALPAAQVRGPTASATRPRALLIIALLGSARAAARESTASEEAALAVPLVADDECAAGAAGCALNALQLQGRSGSERMMAPPEVEAMGMSSQFTNPILRGSFPDPSIIRVKEDYYMVSSSFEYFPGIPIHHSKDLVSWELVGYALHREAQVRGKVNLVDVQSDGGIQAATIRHHRGTFYVVTTNVYQAPNSSIGTCTNFIVTATNVRGPWSDPHVLEGAPGIDASLFFDDNGKVWYTGNHAPDDPAYYGQGEIWLQEVDIATFQLVGDRHYLWRGACNGLWAEGPHIYKKDGRYYLLIAEGGTGYDHAVMLAVSDKITGPFSANPRNPVLTSRHLSYDNWVIKTGHADLVELPDGRWYAVALSVRGDLNRSSNMGRESFLVPVVWEQQPEEYNPRYSWPVLAPETGRIERTLPLPFPGTKYRQMQAFHDSFDSKALNLEWNFRRVPAPGTFSLTARSGFLRLYARPEVIAERGNCSLIGIRQWESDFVYKVRMEFSNEAAEGVEAGLVLWQKDDVYLKYTVLRRGAAFLLRLVLAVRGEEAVTVKEARLRHYTGEVLLRVTARQSRYRFAYALHEEQANMLPFVDTADDLLLYCGYTGAYLGLYASSQGRQTSDFADFDWIQHTALPHQ